MSSSSAAVSETCGLERGAFLFCLFLLWQRKIQLSSKVGVRGARRALENLKMKIELVEQKRKQAERRIALREMALESGEVKVIDMRKK